MCVCLHARSPVWPRPWSWAADIRRHLSRLGGVGFFYFFFNHISSVGRCCAPRLQSQHNIMYAGLPCIRARACLQSIRVYTPADVPGSGHVDVCICACRPGGVCVWYTSNCAPRKPIMRVSRFVYIGVNAFGLGAPQAARHAPFSLCLSLCTPSFSPAPPGFGKDNKIYVCIRVAGGQEGERFCTWYFSSHIYTPGSAEVCGCMMQRLARA